MARKPPNLREQLATALLQIPGHGIAFEEAKAMTPAEVISKFELHHHVHVALGGENIPALMSWMPKAEHRERTAKIDVPTIAKVKRGLKKRIKKAMEEFYAPGTEAGERLRSLPMSEADRNFYRMKEEAARLRAPKKKWPSRKMGSKTHRRTMKGKVVRKTP